MRVVCLSLILGIALSGCGETVEPVRFAMPTNAASPIERIYTPVTSISVREVTLPSYATEEGIALADAGGAIELVPDQLWADDAARSVTLRLTGVLARMTGRQVASDPWPFRDDPQAIVDVRFESFIAEEAGRFVAEGRYYVAQSDETLGDHAHGFRLVQRFDPDAGFAAIAAARSGVIAGLAADIARRGLR
ncbi:MAG: ABC-type transport auxiliary lipoprotein family protein [Pseudomonadota bacterium]